ncbi:MAG TPA: enolase C-terminal domain-like protein [Acidimicrobiia bacterium]|nr:enolase C-terminal domain-like protein [Acidimicrobiia bacterium]
MIRTTLYDVALRFREPLQTTAGVHKGRRSVIVAIERDGVTGWGEAATMPSGAWGTIDEVWGELASSGASGAPRRVGLAVSALQAAHADLEARGAGVPLWRHLGATGRPVRARVTFGLYDDPGDLVVAAERVAATGVTAVKIKIAPGRDLAQVAAVRRALPHLEVSVDANGAYRSPDDPVFAGLDELGVRLIEQPLPPGDLVGAAALRGRIGCSVCLDEAIRSPEDAAAAIASTAADVLSLKIGRLGLAVSREILTMAVDAGIGIKAGGTFDTAVGRHVILAFAGLPGVIDAEAGPPDAYLMGPPGRYPEIVAGEITPDPGPGIGEAVDRETLEREAIRTLEFVREPE